MTGKSNQQVHKHKDVSRICWGDPRHRISVQGTFAFPDDWHNEPTFDRNGNAQIYLNGQGCLNCKNFMGWELVLTGKGRGDEPQ